MEQALSLTFAPHSLRIKYQPSEGSMMIDLSTIQSLELIQNITNVKSKDCLFGLINETLTPMGSRILRSNILQPSTNEDLLKHRWDAVEELTAKEDMFFDTRRCKLAPLQLTCADSFTNVYQPSKDSSMLTSFLLLFVYCEHF